MNKPPNLRTAVAQLDMAPRDIQANFARHLDFIEQARAQDVQDLVFPELSLTGYRQRAHPLGMAYDSEVLARLARAAAEMFVVVGFVEEVPPNLTK